MVGDLPPNSGCFLRSSAERQRVSEARGTRWKPERGSTRCWHRLCTAAPGRLLGSVEPEVTLRQHCAWVACVPARPGRKLRAELENPDSKRHQSTLPEGLNFSNDRALGCHSQYHSLVPGREASDFLGKEEKAPVGGSSICSSCWTLSWVTQFSAVKGSPRLSLPQAGQSKGLPKRSH